MVPTGKTFVLLNLIIYLFNKINIDSKKILKILDLTFIKKQQMKYKI